MLYNVGDKVYLKTKEQLLAEGSLYVFENRLFVKKDGRTSVKQILNGRMENMLGKEVVVIEATDNEGDIMLDYEMDVTGYYFPQFFLETYNTARKTYVKLSGLYENKI